MTSSSKSAASEANLYSIPQNGANRSAEQLVRSWIEQISRWDVPVAAALMALVSFSVPGREGIADGGGLDLIALAKFGIRVGACVWFGGFVLLQGFKHLQRHQGSIPNLMLSGDWTSRMLLPWWCFLAWSFVTISWSPLKAMSIGQWLGLFALLAFAQTVAIRYRVSRYDDAAINLSLPKTDSWKLLVNQLVWIVSCYSFGVLCVHIVAPEWSGLDRMIFRAGNNGFVHPTAVGATSSLGIALCLAILLRGMSSQRWLIVAFLCLHSVTLYLSASRAALGMALLVMLICIVFLMQPRRRGQWTLACGLGLLVLIAVDPRVSSLASQFDDISQYVSRGQSVEELQGVSGRSELWEAVWGQFERSPLVGHGYFVTSWNGKLDVWERVVNHDAHNVGLQVLVTTGIIGGLLLAWALARMAGHLIVSWGHEMRRPSKSTSERDFLWLILLIGVWYAGWAQTCVTFLGPIRPESVVFFALLGLFASHAESLRGNVDSAGIVTRITPSLD